MSSEIQQENTAPRPPIVVVMGHVDHGKSTLLDYIRQENITAKEAGGITQHTYAYEITHPSEDGAEKRITFLDTPGHEAFSLMRTRGAAVADIAILVVAADDGVKAQTIEALNAIREKGMPFIVAINKTDKPDANADRVKQELAENEVFVEGYGGNIPVVAISATTGAGVSDLLDMVLLSAELEGLSTGTDMPAEGTVVEAHRDPKQGISAVLVVRNGTLKQRMYVVSGNSMAPVRRISDPATGDELPEASASTPVRITGFDALPPVGGAFRAYSSKKEAQQAAKEMQTQPEAQEERRAAAQEARTVIPFIVKADSYGTLEAVKAAVEQLETEQVKPEVVHAEVGSISESDIRTVSGSENAIVIGFNVKADPAAQELAERHAITIALFSVIYKMSEWLEEEIERRRPRITEEETIGSAKIMRVFSRTKNKQVIGGRVTSGRLRVGNTVNIFRREYYIGTGTILELQQQKTPAQEIPEDTEFGAMVEARHEIASGDVMEAIEKVEK